MPMWLLPTIGLLLVAVMAALVIRQRAMGSDADPTADRASDLARMYVEMQRYMEAMVVAKKGIKAHPRDCEIRLVLAQVYMAQGKNSQAVEELERLLEISPGHEAAKALLRKLG